MTIQPDHPDFTAAVLGEAPPEELAAFETALAANPHLLSEFMVTRQTADRLRSALKEDPALKNRLTPARPATVPAPPEESPARLSRSSIAALAALPALPAPPSAHPAPGHPQTAGPFTGIRRTAPRRAPVLKKRSLSSRVIPVTAGLAAAVGVAGILLLSGPSSDSAPGLATTHPPTAPAPARPHPEATLPVIALDPGTTSTSPPRTSAPVPSLPPVPRKTPVIFPGSPLEAPATPMAPAPSIATTPPNLQLTPGGAVPAANPQLPAPRSEIAPAPGAPHRRGPVIDTLASPANAPMPLPEPPPH